MITWQVLCSYPSVLEDGKTSKDHRQHLSPTIHTMERPDYYSDKKFCDNCNGYVNYLMGLDTSWCVSCGERVKLYSPDDWDHFREHLESRKTRGGRPRKNTGKESA